MYLTWLSLDTSWLTPLLEARSDRTHLSLQPIITLFLRPLSHLLFCSSFVQRLPSVLFFGPKIDVALPVLAPVIPSRTRQTVQPGGAIHQLPSAVTPHLTAANVDVWLSWKPERQVPVLAPARRCSGALCTMCLRRPGAGGLLWRVATLGEPHGLLFVWTRPPVPGCSLAVAEKNEMQKAVKAQLSLGESSKEKEKRV